MQNTFNVGDHVKAIAFVDCFGKSIPEVSCLVVESITEHARMGMEPYYRVMARPADGLGYIEGAERYFAPEVK